MFAGVVTAQQDPYFTHFMMNRLAYNPGAAGYKDAICAQVLDHRQWTNFEDMSQAFQSNPQGALSGLGPKTFSVNIHSPLNFINSGIGLSIVNDRLGYENNLHVKVSYAYRFKLARGFRLQVGIDYGMLQKGLDGS